MGFSIFSWAFRPWESRPKAAPTVLVYIHFASPLILLAFFLLAFTAHSIATASKDAVVRPSTKQTGPGGKPLPQNTSPSVKARRDNGTLDFSPNRKLLFTWLSVGAVLTFIGSATLVILHAVLARKDNWWCGESVVV